MDNFFNEARDMFITKGWSNFKEELKVGIAACTLDSCSTTEEFWQMRGRLQALRQLVGYENAVKAAEAQQESDNAEVN